jgi:hypothetical protein
MKSNSLMIPLALILAAVCLHAHADVPTTVRVLGCTPGSNAFTVVSPGAVVSMNVSPNANGSASVCGIPTSFPQTYFVKTTVDGGKTWQWTYHVSDFGYSTASTTSTTPTPPVTPPATCPDTFVPVNWTCTAANGVATCTAPLQ